MPVKHYVTPSAIKPFALSLAVFAGGGAVGSALADLSPPSSPDVTVRGADWHRIARSQVAGDFDGDGTTDWAIFDGGASPLGRTEAGLVYILWSAGELTGLIDLASSSSTARSVIIPPINNWGVVSRLGVGDFNDDGKDDLVVGMPCTYPWYYCSGGAHVVFGASVFPDTVDLDAPTIPVSVITADPWVDGGLGFNSTRSDFNGDGIDDLVIAAPDDSPGEVYVIYGGPNFPMSLDLAVPSSAFTRIIDGDEGAGGMGSGLASADVDQDGAEDLLIGSPYDSPNNDGKVTLLFGQVSPPDTLVLGSPATRQAVLVTDPGVGGTLGQSVALADLDGDREVDAAVSALNTYFGECPCQRVVYIVRTVRDLPPITNLDQSPSVARYLGEGSINAPPLAAGDLNADGVADLVVSVVLSSATDSTGVAIVPGPLAPGGTTTMITEDSTVTMLAAEGAGDDFGRALVISDLNNDGTNDLLVGAPDAAGYRGEAYLYFGVPVATSVRPATPRFLAARVFPNPFQDVVTVALQLPSKADVTFRVYDVRGRLVGTGTRVRLTAGYHELQWSPVQQGGKTLPTGIYFGRLEAGARSQTFKMMFIR